MSQNPIRPKILIPNGRINEPVRIPFEDLLFNPTKTILTADMASASGTLTVKNVTGFQINQVLLIGDPGNQGAEIIKTHASTPPSGSTITLASNTAFPHSAGTWVYLINFDRIEISNATTVTGSKTVLVTTVLTPGLVETVYNDTSAPTGFYFARFKNSINSSFSPYSDGTPVAGYTPFMARRLIDGALGSINKKISPNGITDDYAFREIDNCQIEVLREMKRWSFMQKFNQIVTNATVGAIKATLPSDCDDQNTNSSIWNFRIGTLPNMQWVDKAKYDEMTFNISQSTTASPAAVGATSVVLSDSSDFADSGSFYHRTNSSAISYTSNNRGTNTLGGVTALITAISSGVEVYQNPTFGLPQYFTVFGGAAYHYPLVAPSFKNRNYLMDYYQARTTINTDTDTIVLPDPMIVQYYLEWKFLRKINSGIENEGSLAAKENYIERKNLLKIKDNPNRTFRLKPRLNQINERGSNEDQRTKLANFNNI